MRVGVLTFHQALNYGAVLQAYALQRCLLEIGVDCEIVDYRCEALTRAYSIIHLDSPTPRSMASDIMHASGRLARRRRFAEFRDDNLKLSERTYSRPTISEADCMYDAFIVGSDQVWNLELTGGDTTYLLDYCSPEKRISYAASLGHVGAAGGYDEILKESLADYRAISVREEGSREYLMHVLQKEVSWVLDPVFLIPRAGWTALAMSLQIKRPYILVYCLHESGLFSYAELVRESTGLDVVYVPNSVRIHVRGRPVSDPSVQEFLGLIQSADLVLTDSYHVLAFSILFGRDFRVQLKTRLSGLNSRVTSLLHALGLEDRVLRPEDYEPATRSAAPCYDTDCVLESMRTHSQGFLRAALGVGVPR